MTPSGGGRWSGRLYLRRLTEVRNPGVDAGGPAADEGAPAPEAPSLGRAFCVRKSRRRVCGVGGGR